MGSSEPRGAGLGDQPLVREQVEPVMKVYVTIGFSEQWAGRHRILVTEGQATTVSLTSPYLVSAGQKMDVTLAASVIADKVWSPGDRLIDARVVVRKIPRERGIWVDHSPHYCHIPSQRALHAILADVVQHGVDNPGHGIDCICMDRLSYEIKHHILRAVPDRTLDTHTNSEQWAKAFDGRMRIKHVLRRAGNFL